VVARRQPCAAHQDKRATPVLPRGIVRFGCQRQPAAAKRAQMERRIARCRKQRWNRGQHAAASHSCIRSDGTLERCCYLRAAAVRAACARSLPVTVASTLHVDPCNLKCPQRPQAPHLPASVGASWRVLVPYHVENHDSVDHLKSALNRPKLAGWSHWPSIGVARTLAYGGRKVRR
jgi:hypothetical protein